MYKYATVVECSACVIGQQALLNTLVDSPRRNFGAYNGESTLKGDVESTWMISEEPKLI